MPPQRSASYLGWIRTLPCATCGRTPVEAAHTGPHALGRKASDFSAVPLCRDCHTGGPGSYHRLGGPRWAARWKLDLPALVGRLNRCYALVFPHRIHSETEARAREEDDLGGPRPAGGEAPFPAD